jgi:hypothetical protein
VASTESGREDSRKAAQGVGSVHRVQAMVNGGGWQQAAAALHAASGKKEIKKEKEKWKGLARPRSWATREKNGPCELRGKGQRPVQEMSMGQGNRPDPKNNFVFILSFLV